MTDLLTPEAARNALALWHEYQGTDYEISPKWVKRLCRNYLTLWDELEHERDISAKAVKRVTQLEQEIGALMR